MNRFDHRGERSSLAAFLAQSHLAPFAEPLLRCMDAGWENIERHGDYRRWCEGLDALPGLPPSRIELDGDRVTIGTAAECGMDQDALRQALMQLHPWRKGPFELFDMHIDTEWRSDWKWNRLQDAIAPLAGRSVLDVGCGSGYHCWRMLGAGADSVIGIDPTPLFTMQFGCIKRYLPQARSWLIPVGIDELPANMAAFDTVFSMGILYHRRSPIDHLLQLRELLKPGGELVLDTLVVEGNAGDCLVPAGRYAKMRNVWFIPSTAMLQIWLARTGFRDIRLIDVSPTTTGEQRATDWMHFESLPDFLDPNDASRTAEGYPAPVRAIFSATAP